MGRLKIVCPQNQQLVSVLSEALDPGEAGAIALAHELEADRLLIDERAGRRIAQDYGLKIRGLLGILINAKNQGLISKAEPLVTRLIDEAGFRVSPELRKRALREAGE